MTRSTDTKTKVTFKTNWIEGIKAGLRLLADPKDTRQVFLTMEAMNGRSSADGYSKLIETKEGGEIAYAREELADKLIDRDYTAQFAPGTVGHKYRQMIDATGYSADGLADISNLEGATEISKHPVDWFARRTRDVHDLWHVLSGYSPDEPIDEACLVAFSYAQTRGKGWATIAGLAMLKGFKEGDWLAVKSIREAYRNGKKAAWLLGEDYHALLNENLDDARRRLNIAEPKTYYKYRATTPIEGNGFSLLPA